MSEAWPKVVVPPEGGAVTCVIALVSYIVKTALVAVTVGFITEVIRSVYSSLGATMVLPGTLHV